MSTESELRALICEVGRRMYAKNLVSATDGNISVALGEGKVSSEFFTHLAAYEERPEIRAVVHAHPPKAVGCTLAGFSLTDYLLPEVVFAVGGIPVTEYATPGTVEGAGVIRELIRECDAVLLDRHGAVTVGLDLLDAYYKMEKVEHAAESILTAQALGSPKTLSDAQFERILEARESYGATGKVYPRR